MTEILASINAADLARVAPFVAKGDVRYYLNGVSIEPAPGGAVIVATNGHMLAANFSPNSHVQRKIILPMNAAFLTKLRSARGDGTVTVDDEKAFPVLRKIGDVTYVHPARLIDGQFPDWRKVVGSADEMAEGIPGGYQIAYLKAAIDAVTAAIGKDRFSGVRFLHTKERPTESPVVIRPVYGDASDLIVVVMPMRGGDYPTIPAWAEKLKAATPAAAA